MSPCRALGPRVGPRTHEAEQKWEFGSRPVGKLYWRFCSRHSPPESAGRLVVGSSAKSLNKMLRLIINTIPPEEHRYPTCGDYQIALEKGVLRGHVDVSRLPGRDAWKKEFLIAVHELIEAGLCRAACIPDSVIDRFDMAFEGDTEPGDSARAPYYRQHQIATGIERLLAAELKVSWEEYEDLLDEYWKKAGHKDQEGENAIGANAEVPGHS